MKIPRVEIKSHGVTYLDVDETEMVDVIVRDGRKRVIWGACRIPCRLVDVPPLIDDADPRARFVELREHDGPERAWFRIDPPDERAARTERYAAKRAAA